MYIHICKNSMYSDLLERYIIIKCGYLPEMGVIGRQVEGGREALTVYLLYMSECILFVYKKTH